MRALLFILWIQAGKSADKTQLLLEALVKGQYEVASRGGARIVQAQVQGKSFNYELPEGQTASAFHELLRQAYAELTTGGTSGAALTDTQLKTYVTDNDDVANVTRARFAHTTRV